MNHATYLNDEPHNEARPSVERLISDILRLVAVQELGDGGAAELDSTLTAVMTRISDALACDAATLFLFDPYTETLRLRATSGLNADAVGRIVIRIDSGITGLAARTRRTQIAPIAHEHPAYLPYPLSGDEEYVGHASIPIVLHDPDRLVGILNLQTLEPHDFESDELRLIEAAAESLAIGVASALRYSETQEALARRVDQLTVLQSATGALATTLELDDLIELVTHHAERFVEGSRATIYRFAPSGDAVRQVRLDVGVECPELRAYALMICQTRIARTVQPRAATDNRLYGIPLLTQRGVWGALCLTAEPPSTSPDEQLSALQAFADAATLALENAELYEHARRESATNAMLVQEMHHRVRNNLQIVAALLSLQANNELDASVEAPLRSAVLRVQSIAAMHDLLSSGTVVSTTLRAILERVVAETIGAVIPPDLAVEFSIESDEIAVGSRQATILALLVTECLTNAILHGFAGRTSGRIALSAVVEAGCVTVSIADDGVGLKTMTEPAAGGGLGLRIVRTLATADLGGTFELVPNDPSGTRAVFSYPLGLPVGPSTPANQSA